MNTLRRLLTAALLAGPVQASAQDPHAAKRERLVDQIVAADGRDAAAKRDATSCARRYCAPCAPCRGIASCRRASRCRRVSRPAAADRTGPDHLAAFHRRADDRASRSRAQRARARGRHRLGLPGGGARRMRGQGLHHRDRARRWASRRARCSRSSAIATSRSASATATRGGRKPRRSTPSSSPRRPTTCRSRSSISSRPGGKMVIPVGSLHGIQDLLVITKGDRRQGGDAAHDRRALRAPDAGQVGRASARLDATRRAEARPT